MRRNDRSELVATRVILRHLESSPFFADGYRDSRRGNKFREILRNDYAEDYERGRHFGAWCSRLELHFDTDKDWGDGILMFVADGMNKGYFI